MRIPLVTVILKLLVNIVKYEKLLVFSIKYRLLIYGTENIWQVGTLFQAEVLYCNVVSNINSCISLLQTNRGV